MGHTWKRGEVYSGFCLRGTKVRDHWEDLGVGGRITLIGNWIRLAQDMVRWRAFVNTVMNFGFHKESRLLFDKLSDYKLCKEYPAPWSK